MTRIILVVLLVAFAAERVMSGHPCRFDSSSTSRGKCIFPCRCTTGCDQVTGQCLDHGQCSDGPPSGYKWGGPACQIGNVAFHKIASQSTAKWNERYPATKAVDGSIDQSYQHCAVPNGVRGTSAWWKVDLGENCKISRVIIYNGNKECKAGYFGWRCRFQCHKCPTCDRVTGRCPSTCQDNRWGVGCLLSANCYYDDEKGKHYKGRTSVGYTGHNRKRTCRFWIYQRRKPDSSFPDGSRSAARNYCRNPDTDDKPWCYYNNNHNWVFCRVNRCPCDSRRFGVNCKKECHCNDENENCQNNSPIGRCTSGCAPHFTGPTCQECEDGHFGVFCDGTCHCSSGSCDKTTGRCPSGCATGWTGDNCQKENQRLSAFTLSVGNTSDVNGHAQCASHNGAVAAGATVNESCTATGQYLSFRVNGEADNHVTTLCEVVVIGHRHISCQHCPSTSTCNDVIGCDACAPGKQQPDCVQDCIDKTYGVNCTETCGNCTDQSMCAITTGSCPNGCETWYISDVCKTLIAKPKFQSFVNSDVNDVTNSSATVSWPRATDVPTGLEGHYHYVLWLQADGGREKNVTRVEQGAGEQRLNTRIIGLTFNTNYSLRVEPYREHNGEREGGASTGVVTLKTTCIAPSPTVIEGVTPTIPGPTSNGSIVVNWQKITESGCDVVTTVRVEYKVEMTDSWTSVEPDSVTTINVTIESLSYERYEVRLIVINNENIQSTSASKYVDFRITIPGFRSSVKPDVDDVTSSNATVSWPRATNVSAGMEDHYHYLLWLQADGERETNVTRIEQGAGEQKLETRITGLTFNTKYTLRVEPYRELYGEYRGGASTGDITFKTTCIDREQSQQTSGKTSPTGIIAGSTSGAIVLIAVASIVVGVVLLRRRRKETDNTPDAAIEAMEGAEQQNGKLGDGNETAAVHADDEAVEDTSGLYANTQQLALTRGIKVGDLAAYFEDKKRHNGFQKEFAELPPGVRAKCEAAHKPGNKNKNRFINIVAYDHTRVVLSTDTGQSDYVNANHIMGYMDKASAYIATQGPKDWTIVDMWRMVWQEKTNTIVMLANIYELGKEKCNQYWPDTGKTKTWGNFIAESIKEEQFADYVIREFSLKNQGVKKMRRIRQLHFTAWPDKGTPDYAYPLLAFHRKVHSFDSERRGPLLVHCSAGIGRTGTFIAIDILTQQAAAEGKVDVFQCVNLLRTQRMDMVQTLEQYVYVFQALVDSSEDTVIPCSQLKQSFDELCEGNKLDEQLKRLNALKTLAKSKKCAALEPKNLDKNRYIEIIPDDHHRPYLMTPWKDGTNYINAVTVHGYKQRNAYILTQSPMTTTVVDLWRLLNDHESRTIVMLDDVEDTDGCSIYWPNKKEPKCQYGPFQVELTETNFSENPNVTMRDFKLTEKSKPDDTGVTVRQFHLKKNTWKKNESVPSNRMLFLDLLDLVEKWQQQSENGPITMHCSDGASRCGVLVAAGYILEHLKVEQEVDVFHAVQHVRTTRPQLVTNLEQYRFLYQVALAYMSQFDMYANFQ